MQNGQSLMRSISSRDKNVLFMSELHWTVYTMRVCS